MNYYYLAKFASESQIQMQRATYRIATISIVSGQSAMTG